MKLEVPEDFQRKVDAFNDSRGGPVRVAVVWDPKAVKFQTKVLYGQPVYDYNGRWKVYSVPTVIDNKAMKAFARPLPDDSGRLGMLVFTWCKRNEAGDDVGFEPLDDRIFKTLDELDTFKDRDSYDRLVNKPTERKEEAERKGLREIAGAQAEYFRFLDKLTVSMNPATRGVRGDWRALKPWR